MNDKWSPHAFVALVLIPFTDNAISCCWYSCLPLYIFILGKDLVMLGIVAGVVPILRMIVLLLGRYFLPGRLEFMKIPLQIQCIMLAVYNLFYPYSLIATYLNVYGMIMLTQRAIYQTISVKVWPDNRTAALRVSEACWTIGYCTASFWSGAAYHYGGWEAVVWGQVVILSVTILLELVCMPHLCSWKDRDSQTTDPDPDPDPPLTSDDVISDWKCYFLCIGMFIFVFGYAVEWGIFAPYLSAKFGLNTLIMGVGQMVGDLSGSMLLLCTTSTPLMTRQHRGIFQLPFGLVWIALLFSLTLFGFASNNKHLAMAAQIIMGTMIVLSM